MKNYCCGRLFPGVMELRTRAVELWLTRQPKPKPGNTLISKYDFTLDYTESSDSAADDDVADTSVAAPFPTSSSAQGHTVPRKLPKKAKKAKKKRLL